MTQMSLTNNFFVRYVKECRDELSKVAWPSRQTVVMHSGMVIAICISLALFLGAVDYAATYGFTQLLNR